MRIAPMDTGQPRYRVVVEWERWRVRQDGGERVEVVGECEKAGGLVPLLAVWKGMPGVARLWYESRRSDGQWQTEGRAA